MFLWPGVLVSGLSFLGLLDQKMLSLMQGLWKHKQLLWDFYFMKQQAATLNHTFLLFVKKCYHLPCEQEEAPWKTYADVQSHFATVWPYLLSLEETTREKQLVKGSAVVNLSSYSYLSVLSEEQIRDYVMAEMCKGHYTFGNHGPRMLGGNNAMICQLEQELARFTGREAALCFSSGFLACKSAIQAVVGPKDVIFADARIHESLRDGVRAAQAKGAKVYFFKHNDFERLAELLETQRGKYEAAYLIVESVYSMDGDFTDLKTCQVLATKYQVKIILDEAHGLGILGQTGRGLEEVQDCAGAAWLVVGSLTKALGSVGGYICGPALVIQFLHFFATGTMFSAPLSVPNALAAYKALKELQEHPEWLEGTRENMAFLRQALQPFSAKYGVKVQSEVGSPLVAFILQDFSVSRVFHIVNQLLQQGFYVACVMPPACPLRESRLRLTAPRGLKRSDLVSFVTLLDQLCQDTMTMQDPELIEVSELLTQMGFLKK